MRCFFSGDILGGELASIAAALETINQLENHGALEHMHKMGRRMMEGYKNIVQKTGI